MRYGVAILSLVLLLLGNPSPLLSQEIHANQLCRLVPASCTVEDSAGGDLLRVRPDIEYNLCDVWPELCSLGEPERAFAQRQIDICVLAPEGCELVDSNLAIDRSQQLLQQGSSDLCLMVPEACSSARGSELPIIEYNLCDEFPELCMRGNVQIADPERSVNACVFSPDDCVVSDYQLAQEVIDGAIRDAVNR